MSTPIGMRAVVRAAAGIRVLLEMSAMRAGLLLESETTCISRECEYPTWMQSWFAARLLLLAP